MADNKNYTHVFFDLYGTLLDIATDEESDATWEVLRKFLAENGAEYEDVKELKIFWDKAESKLINAQGFNKEESEYDIAKLYKEASANKGIQSDDKLAAEAARVFRDASRKFMNLYPGTVEMLRKVKDSGRQIVLLSNAQTLFTVPEIEAVGLDKEFEHIFISSEFGWKKPSAKFYDYAAEKLGCDKNSVLMVGNDPVCDIDGAKNAGIDAFYFLTGVSPQNSPEVHPDAVVSCAGADYDELLKYLQID